MRDKKLILVAVLLGVVVVLLVNARFSALENDANPPTVSLYRAVVDVPPGTTVEQALESRAGRLREVPRVPLDFARAHPDALDKAEYEVLKERTIQRTIRAGEFLRLSDLEGYAPTEVTAKIPPGHVATTLSVNVETSVGYLISPGDRVDVYLTRMAADPARRGGQLAQVEEVARDVLVFAVDNLFQGEGGERTRFRGKDFRSVTLAVQAGDVTRLLGKKTEGTLTLVLRGPRAE